MPSTAASFPALLLPAAPPPSMLMSRVLCAVAGKICASRSIGAAAHLARTFYDRPVAALASSSATTCRLHKLNMIGKCLQIVLEGRDRFPTCAGVRRAARRVLLFVRLPVDVLVHAIGEP